MIIGIKNISKSRFVYILVPFYSAMKGIQGYLITIASLIIGFIGMIWLINYGILTGNPFQSVFLVIFFAGFLGGFFAPYHIKQTAIKSTLTIFAVIVGFAILFWQSVTDQVNASNDPLAGLALLIVVIIVGIILLIVLLAGTIIIGFSGYIGSLFGNRVFEEYQFSDLEVNSIDNYENPVK